MTLPSQLSLLKTRRLGQVALTALAIGLGGAAIAALPLGNLAFAGNGNGNGGGHGHDGGHGGGNGGGNGGGQGHGGGQNHGGGSGKADKGSTDADDSTTDDSTADTTTDDDSLAAHNLGKLNGFFHASPNGLANASPNSSIGRISHTFKDALSAFAEASETETDPNAPEDPNATPPTGPSADDLGAILAGATNKPVTSAQVKAIIERLAEQNPDDASLNDLADSVDSADDETCQDIADAANAAKSGETTDESDDDTTDTSSDGTTSDGTDSESTDGATTVVTTN